MIKINHIAIVVPGLEAAQKFWVEALGLPLERIASVPQEGVDVAFLPAGEAEIELLQPVDPESGVARYLEKRGPGMHHLCLEVENLEATLTRLREAGVELITEQPRRNAEGRTYAFVHPRSTGGVLVELYAQAPGEGPMPDRGMS
jgi:methylmalonyl-CoA/ethylmalonyl-CoA epimerase